METEIMNRQSFEAVSNKNKRKRVGKNQQVNGPNSHLPPTATMFNDLLMLNPSGIEDGPKPRSHANARERDRTHRFVADNSVNSAFTLLRTLIPTEPADRKLSKIETLRLASSYIAHLGTQLLAGQMDQPCLKHHGPTPGYDSASPRPVCTFCLSSMKKVKNPDGFSFRDSSQTAMNTSHPSRYFRSTQDMATTSASDPFETNMNLLFF